MIGTQIFNSRFQSPSFYSLSQKLNIKNRNEGYPGPGAYTRFSEFGILDTNYKKKNKVETEKTKDTDVTKNEENHNETNPQKNEEKEGKKEEPKYDEEFKETKNESKKNKRIIAS